MMGSVVFFVHFNIIALSMVNAELPTLSDTFVCLNGDCSPGGGDPSSYTCETDKPCSIRCDGRFSCSGATFRCPPSAPCNIDCANSACENAKFYCPSRAECNIECNACRQTTIYSYESSNNMNTISMNCGFCLKTIIRAEKASKLNITCTTTSVGSECFAMKIYCPPSSANGPNCYIKGNGKGSSPGGMNGQEQDFYLYGGWQDIAIESSSTSRRGTMYCGSDYGTSCAVGSSTENNGTWGCVNDEVPICPTYSPTPRPTYHPTRVTIAPTKYPSQFPTLEPTEVTGSPSVLPTNNPTATDVDDVDTSSANGRTLSLMIILGIGIVLLF